MRCRRPRLRPGVVSETLLLRRGAKSARRLSFFVSPLSCRAEVGLNYEVVPNLFNIDKSAVDCLWWYTSA